jgi:SAM-dependent methyltransferase
MTDIPLPQKTPHPLTRALWKIYRRGQPLPWQADGNLPWDDPDFSERMLQEHLDESHGAASRTTTERRHQLDWLWPHLNLHAGAHLFDVTCGPGLYAVDFARQGCAVTGIDFSPASIDYARMLARAQGVSTRCEFVLQDVRHLDEGFRQTQFDAAILLYGQLAVFPKEAAKTLLTRLAQLLKPGGRLCIELLNQANVDKTDSNWWFTDDAGLWGGAPYLHLGERVWLADDELSVERYFIIHLETGKLTEVMLSDQTYSSDTMVDMLHQAGFCQVNVYPAWDGLPLSDASEWLVYIAQRA